MLSLRLGTRALKGRWSRNHIERPLLIAGRKFEKFVVLAAEECVGADLARHSEMVARKEAVCMHLSGHTI